MNLSKKIILGIGISIVISIVIVIIGFRYKDFKHNRYIDINSLVKKAYTSTGEYDFNMAKNFSKEVYNCLNIYAYNKSLRKEQIKISLNLNEINQHKINNKIFIYMICSIEVRDNNGKMIMGSIKDPVVFTVVQTSGKLYIERAQGYQTPDEVPKIYK